MFVFLQIIRTGYTNRLLAFSNFEDSTSQSGKSHVEFLEFVLEVYGMSLENVVASIPGKCSTTRSISERYSKPLSCFSSHHYNLAVTDFIDTHKVVIEKVSVVMSRLRYLVAAAKLRTQASEGNWIQSNAMVFHLQYAQKVFANKRVCFEPRH